MSALRNHPWGVAYLVCFVAGLIACFAAPPGFFWISIVAAFGGGVGTLQAFLYKPPRPPFKKVFVHEDWVFAALDADFPRLYISAETHGMGKKPELAFRQGDYVFPYDVDGQGNIVVVRNNHSIGRFANLGVVITESLQS